MLEAMDVSLRVITEGFRVAGTEAEPRDADLPALFRALDHQFELAMARSGCTQADAA